MAGLEAVSLHEGVDVVIAARPEVLAVPRGFAAELERREVVRNRAHVLRTAGAELVSPPVLEALSYGVGTFRNRIRKLRLQNRARA